MKAMLSREWLTANLSIIAWALAVVVLLALGWVVSTPVGDDLRDLANRALHSW